MSAQGFSREGTNPQPPQQTGSQSQDKLKALSPNVHVVYSEDYRVRRLPISPEEADAINNGGMEVSDWKKIKL